MNSLQTHLLHVIRVGNLHSAIAYTLIGACATAYLSYLEASLISTIITSEGDITSCIVKLGFVQVISHYMNTMTNSHRQETLTPIVEKTARNHFWKLLENSDPEWLANVNGTHVAIANGVTAISDIVNQSIRFIKPILQVVSQMVVVLCLVGYKGFMVIFIIAIIMTCGVFIIHYDFEQMKKINKNNADIKEYARHQAETFLINLLNGRGKQARQEIVDSWEQTTSQSTKHKIKLTQYYMYLEQLHTVLVCCCILYLSYFISGREFVAVFFAISKTCDYSWWLFHSVTALMRTAAGWGSLEKILDEYVPMDKTPDDQMSMEFVLPKFDMNISEIRLKGDSGDGKTTWMMRKVTSLYKRFKAGQWIYLDQKMKIPNTDRCILEVMSDYLPPEIDIDTCALYKYSLSLGIDNLINGETVHRTFNKPSGGEEKRILFLRAVIPVIMRTSNVQVMFCDEVTAGLDRKTCTYVRELISSLKTEFGIKFMTIDHHDIETDCTLSVQKRIEKIEADKSFYKETWFDAYRQTKPQKSLDKIYVWIPDVEVPL